MPFNSDILPLLWLKKTCCKQENSKMDLVFLGRKTKIVSAVMPGVLTALNLKILRLVYLVKVDTFWRITNVYGTVGWISGKTPLLASVKPVTKTVECAKIRAGITASAATPGPS